MTKDDVKQLMTQAGVVGMKRRSDGFYVVEEEVFYRFAQLIIDTDRHEIANHYDANPRGVHIGANIATWVRARNQEKVTK